MATEKKVCKKTNLKWNIKKNLYVVISRLTEKKVCKITNHK